MWKELVVPKPTWGGKSEPIVNHQIYTAIVILYIISAMLDIGWTTRAHNSL
jgi:hypothetical protein